MQTSRWHAAWDAHMRYMSPLQELACRRAVDTIYRQEKPLSVDEAARAIGFAHPAELTDAFSRFFNLTDDGWTRPEIMADITKAKARRDRAATARRQKLPALATPTAPKTRKPARKGVSEIKPDVSLNHNVNHKLEVNADIKPDINLNIKPDINADINADFKTDINGSAKNLGEVPIFSAARLSNYPILKSNTFTASVETDSEESSFSPLRSEKERSASFFDPMQAASRPALNLDRLQNLDDPEVVRQLWAHGAAVLCAAGSPMKSAKSLLAMLCRDHGERRTMRAVRALLTRESKTPLAGDPAGYLRKTLQHAADSGDDDQIEPCPAWCERAGFENIWEAGNADCRQDNADQFRDGKRIAA